MITIYLDKQVFSHLFNAREEKYSLLRNKILSHKDEFIFCAQTANQRVAAKVEEIAKELGFEIGDVEYGGNGTNSYSIYIYAYVITRDSKQ